MGNTCTRKPQDKKTAQLMDSALNGLAKMIDEIPDMEVKNILLNWCETKLNTTCSQLNWIISAVNGMYKEIEHADYMIKQSLKNNKDILRESLEKIHENNYNEIKFLRNSLFYDDEELYLYIQKLLKKTQLLPTYFTQEEPNSRFTTPKKVIPGDFDLEAGLIENNQDIRKQVEEITEIVEVSAAILARAPQTAALIDFKCKPKQVTICTRMTTNSTWAIWDDLIALGDADGFISFVDAKTQKY
jgi:hypothetical protein